MPAAGRAFRLGMLAVALLAVGALPTRAAPGKPRTARDADSLAATPPTVARDRALTGWARHARLAELLYLLRRPPQQLGGAEAALVDAALDRTPPMQRALTRRLIVRRALADPHADRRSLGALAPYAGELGLRPFASAFRVAALLPDSGDYRDYGRAVTLGVACGLAQAGAGGALPLELEVHGTGDSGPGRVAAALDSAAEGAGAVVGELLSGPTLALAVGTRLLGLSLFSPTATDEGVGAAGSNVFQVGPSGLQRGAVLARAVLAGEPRRVALLLSSVAERGSFAAGFAAAAAGLGSTVEWRESYAPGNGDFRATARTLKAKGIQVVFWDGEAREAETLLRQLAGERVNVRVCGGQALDPADYHAETRALLEGVQYVADDWRLPAASQAVLDSLVRMQGVERANSLHVRGYLAARLIASAVANGALCPEEITTSLAGRVGADPYLHRRGFIDWRPDEATLPVFTVTRGRAVLAQ